MIKILLLILNAAKLGPLVKTGGTMLISVVVYAFVFGPWYAVGVVALLFAHEMGHFVSARRLGLDVGAPTFIPFVGAWIELKDAPLSVAQEARIAFAGPFVGTAAALAVLFAGLASDSRLLLAVAYSGLVLNLFNLVPVTPFDGGRIVAILSPKIWLLGAPILVASGVLSFLFQWRSILRAFQSFGGGANPAGDEDPRVAATEVPTSWFGVGMLFSGVGVVAIAALFFEVPVHLGVLAVFMTFALALVAARITGESDITPTGAMGKIMQLTYGVLLPQSATANLMTAGITAGAASSTADLLTDLKSGYVLGANPRRQFLAQVFGIIPGTIATVIGFRVLVPDATALTGTGDTPAAFPAPSAQAWKAVAEVFREGIGNMHPAHQNAIAVGLIFGAALVLAERFLPKLKPYLPSASGLGLGFILPFNYPLAMLAGALLTFGWEKLSEKSARDYVVPVSSGIIAGVSIVGVLVQAINNFVLGGGGGH
jgi:Zn-dependent protease